MIVWLTAIPAHGHHMGRPVPVGYTGTGNAHLAAQVIASYFEEQMGLETELSGRSSVQECLEMILDKKTPMAVVPEIQQDRIPDGVVLVLPALNTGSRVYTLVMGREARENLQFSLVQRYMELLSSRLSYDEWKKGIIRVNSGEGVRKVALDMLREADLL